MNSHMQRVNACRHMLQLRVGGAVLQSTKFLIEVRHIEVDFDCHATSEDVELHATTRKAGTSHARGKGNKLGKKRGKVQKPLVKKGRPSDLREEYDFGDEHASVGEEEECKDELLEIEGPVFHESDDETDLSIVCIPKWKSGDNLRVEPDGTFKKLPSFVDIAGPDLGQIPRELTEIQLFLALSPLDLVDMIVHAINRYALENRERALCKHGSTRKWSDLDRHGFLPFLGVSFGSFAVYT
ncbi:hypothetical protein GOP47_0016213 [Adiantum capillus-veneris]|uniref:Uncharacterized protein n=1 Tax=Adiantum capillus-veneris TaxID=13818 RepID=A0A9D4ZA31_ADICA|nr:hypothetical protein GOP47_0016213 [Adiantum capillus-veneris]